MKPKSQTILPTIVSSRLLRCLAALSLAVGGATTATAQSQAQVKPDSSQVETGNPLALHFRVPLSAGRPVGPDLNLEEWAGQLPTANILGQTPWARDSLFWEKTVTAIFFDEDTVTLPPLPIPLTNGSAALTAPLSIRVYATPSPDDLNDMAPIKDIFREPASWTDYLPWLFGAALLAAFAWLVFQIWKRKREKTAHSRSIAMPPHLLALQKLENLRQKKWAEQGLAKAHCGELSWILREYIENRFGLPALETTTAEIMGSLRAHGEFPENWLPDVQQVLEETDLAKFAQSTPSLEFQLQALEAVRKLVEETGVGFGQSAQSA